MWKSVVSACTKQERLDEISQTEFPDRAAAAFLMLHTTENPNPKTPTEVLVRELSRSLKAFVCGMANSKKEQTVFAAPDNFNAQLILFFKNLKECLGGVSPKQSVDDNFLDLLLFSIYMSDLDKCQKTPPKLTYENLKKHEERNPKKEAPSRSSHSWTEGDAGGSQSSDGSSQSSDGSSQTQSSASSVASEGWTSRD